MISTILILLGIFIVVAPISGHPWLKAILILILMIIALLLGCGVLYLGSSCG
jgi:hypothetical protein